LLEVGEKKILFKNNNCLGNDQYNKLCFYFIIVFQNKLGSVFYKNGGMAELIGLLPLVPKIPVSNPGTYFKK
jgi:hypothetical protein